MRIRRATTPVASGNQRNKQQQEVDRAVWESWQILLSGEDNSLASEPMNESDAEEFIKRLDSAANFHNKSKSTNFRVKSELRDAEDIDFLDENEQDISDQYPEDADTVVAFKVVQRTERLSMRGPRGPRNKSAENGADENGHAPAKRSRKTKAEDVPAEDNQPEYQG